MTSGTTGRPRFVVMPEASRRHVAHAMLSKPAETLPRVRLLNAAAASTGWALNTILPVLLGGGSAIVLDEQSDQALQFADLYGATHLAVSPLLLEQVLHTGMAPSLLSGLEEIEVAGACAPSSLLRALAEATPARIVQRYGATETGALACLVHDRDAPAPDGALGRVIRDDLEVMLLGDDLQPLPETSAEGILAVRLPPEAMARYMGEAPDASESGAMTGFRGDLFVTGDVARREADGLRLVGRRSRLLNYGGNKYALDLVAAELVAGLPAGVTLAVAAARAPDGLEELVVYYASEEEIRQESFDAALKARWPVLQTGAVYRVPRIPLTPAGKVDMAALEAERRGLHEGR